jgi:hypothetical protein
MRMPVSPQTSLIRAARARRLPPVSAEAVGQRGGDRHADPAAFLDRLDRRVGRATM